MTTQPECGIEGELLPRPARTPEALRLAIARLAPHRLTEMEQQKEHAFSLAAQHDSLGPLRSWLLIWAGEVAIERRTDLSRRRAAAEALAQTRDRDDPAWREAMDELLNVINEGSRGHQVNWSWAYDPHEEAVVGGAPAIPHRGGGEESRRVGSGCRGPLP